MGGASSNFLYLLSDYFRIVFLNLFSTHSLVIKRAIVLVSVAMQRTEEVTTSAVKPFEEREREREREGRGGRVREGDNFKCESNQLKF